MSGTFSSRATRYCDKRDDDRMTIRDWLKIVGIGMICVGLLSFPLGFGMSPKRDLSAFSNLADLGVLIRFGMASLVIGGVLLATSLFIPRSDNDE